MKDYHYILENFFTHKDFLVPADQIPGTLFTPLQFIFEAILLSVILCSAVYVSRHKQLVRPVLMTVWVCLVIWEFVIVTWDSVAGKTIGLDLTTNLSLYPCSIYLYAMPFFFWGRELFRRMACGYVCTLGLLGAVVNFLYPVSRLTSYSCISFAGFHTFFFHGSMLFTCLVMLLSGNHRYTRITHSWELLLPCVPSLLLSIPANIVNYSPIHADYMYFRGEFPLLAKLFANLSDIRITLILYLLYITIPALFYLPSYLAHKRREFLRQSCSLPDVQLI